MKKILLLMIFATLSWQHALAQNFTYGGITYNVTSATTVEVIYQGGGVSGNVTIPAQVADGNIDYSVTSIGNSAFYNSPNLTVVTIPNTVTSIGASAFQFCSGLTSVNIPDLVTSIGNSAFSNCSSLTSIALPNSVTSIGTFAFSRCSGLTSVTMSNNLVSIPAGAFFSCTSLPAITIASTVESIGANAFGICYNLRSVICNRATPPAVSENSFSGWNQFLCSLTVPAGSVAAYQAASVWQIFSPIVCSGAIDNTTTISACGSYNWVHNNQTYTSSGVYSGSTTNCVTEKLELTITTPPTSFSYNNLNYVVTGTNTVAVGINSGASGAVTIPATVTNACGTYDVTSIGQNAFNGCSGITSVTIPSSVWNIGNSAFKFCSGLTSVTIPTSVTLIDNNAFQYSGLLSIAIPNSVTVINPNAFSYCQSLTSLTIPNSVTAIHAFAFLYCYNLTSITIPSSVIYIGEYAFNNCSGLTSVTCNLTQPLGISANVFGNVNTGACSLTVPPGSVAAYQDANVWQNFAPITAPCSPSDSTTTVSACGSYTWAHDGLTYNESGTYTGSTTDCVTQKLDLIITTRTTPTFTPVASICSGATLSDLPSISNEGITGTWAPALNNLATTTYTFTPEAGQCAATASMTIVVNSIIAPTFSQVATICSGATLANLPTTSINEIVGNWSPEVSNTETKTYTFTPNEGQCGETSTLTITVTPSVTPTFNAVESICTGGVLSDLPTTSNNGITGTWSPELSNVATKTYTFTPTADQCAIATTLTITVNPIVTPTFVAIGAICQGQSLQPLPTTSTNGITGNWSYSPALSNVASKTYTFTPALGQCAIGTTLTITVNPTVIPTFTAVAPICSGATDAALPIASNNGIAGTWSPAFSNTATTTYTFAANPGQCASTTNPTLKITVKPKTTPIFKQVSAVCLGATIADLPTTSLNAVTGSWSPAIDNTTTTTYTFTPTDAVCNNGTTMTITVKPVTTPTFTQVAPICWAGTISGLNLTSSNGVTGSWSPAQNSAATTTYTFTPTAGLCANKTEMTIIVIPKTKPTFNPVIAVCSGATLNPLPTTSNNLFTGTWSPALDNSVSKTYTFTPTVGQCASIAILRITVNPKTTPTFTQVAAICPGATLAALPTTSNNFFTGTWSPDLDTSVTKTYTFTPSANQCASTKTMTIVVNNTAPGTITGGNVAVCFPGTGLNTNDVSTNFTNSTTLTLNGNSVGSTIQWQRSLNATSASPSWTTFANATTTNNGILINGNTLTVSNLTSTTWYRARVTNGTCFTFTEPTKITVNPLANAGTVTSETSVCAFNSITFTSSAYIGSAIAWEVSTATATTGFTTVAGQTGSTYVMTSAPPATFYVRSVVTSGCSIERSIAKKIKVISASTPGKIRGGGTVCLGSNKQLKITGNFGTIQLMYSTNGTNFMNVPSAGNGVATTFSTTSTSSSASSYAVNNITGTTFFKALVTNGSCSSLETNVVKYSVATAATAGIADAEPPFVCVGTGTTITLTNFAGDITWQKASSSTAANPTWTAITGAVNPILSTGNLTTATKYRASVTIGTCAPVVTSNPIVITLISCATTSKQIAAPSEIAEPFSVVAYPNPSNNVFNFKVNVANDDDVSMLVFDMMGRQIENKVVKANDIENISLGQNYSSGVYNVIVSQGMNTKTVKLVKK